MLQFKDAIGGTEKAVYQSFACFLAFDRVLQNSNQFVLWPSEITKKILNFIANDDEKPIKSSEGKPSDS